MRPFDRRLGTRAGFYFLTLLGVVLHASLGGAQTLTDPDLICERNYAKHPRLEAQVCLECHENDSLIQSNLNVLKIATKNKKQEHADLVDDIEFYRNFGKVSKTSEYKDVFETETGTSQDFLKRIAGAIEKNIENSQHDLQLAKDLANLKEDSKPYEATLRTLQAVYDYAGLLWQSYLNLVKIDPAQSEVEINMDLVWPLTVRIKPNDLRAQGPLIQKFIEQRVQSLERLRDLQEKIQKLAKKVGRLKDPLLALDIERQAYELIFTGIDVSTFPDLGDTRGNADKEMAKTCGLTSSQALAIREYGSYDYAFLNAALRSRDSESYALYNRKINEALKKLKPISRPVQRVAALPANILDLHQPGQIVKYPAFTSTSLTKYVWDEAHRFIIYSNSGRYVAHFMRSAGEDEVLFAPDTNFKVLDRKELPDGRFEFVMQEVE